MTTIDLGQSQPSIQDLLQLAAGGNEVLLLQEGRPVGKLTSLAPQSSSGRKHQPNLQPNSFIFLNDDFNAPLPPDCWGGDV